MRSILQSTQWAEFKKTQGFEILDLDGVFIHKRSLPLGQNFLYLPEVSADDISPVQIEKLKQITAEQKSIFARLELADRFSDNAQKMVRSFGFRRAFEQVQPKWRQVIDLTKSEDEILAQMKQKGRYNIKIAQRSDVVVSSRASKRSERVERPQDDQDSSASPSAGGSARNDTLQNFYKLYSETVRREKITGRSLNYFENMVDKFSETDYLEIYIASHKGAPIAGALVSFYEGVASYLYGGSSREYKEVMAPYLMHWEIMREAKRRGMKSYDLLGRDPLEKSGKWSGVTRFKEQFGGEALEILGSFDYVGKSLAYRVFKMAEKIRRK